MSESLPNHGENLEEPDSLASERAKPEKSDSKTEGKKEWMKAVIKEFAERNNMDLNTAISIYACSTIERMNKKFRRKYGVSAPEKELPGVVVIDGRHPSYLASTTAEGDKTIENQIILGNIDDALSGDVLSEELAHFYRCRLQPRGQKREYITDEFFGFLGTRLFLKLVEKKWWRPADSLSALKDEHKEFPSKRQTLAFSKKVKEFMKTREGTAEDLDIDSPKNRANDLRRDMLTHQRGYEWASKLDLGRIHNWHKLFSLSNEEVRKRFFTSEQDYSDL